MPPSLVAWDIEVTVHTYGTYILSLLNVTQPMPYNICATSMLENNMI